MRVKLKWVNHNNNPVQTKIYRTESVVKNNQLGEPLVTLDGNILEWIDNTVVYGKTYYYVFGVIGGLNELFSIPLKVNAVYSTGPGPSKLEFGDQQLGYFGRVSALDFLTVNELQLLAGYPQVAVANPLQAWDKWYRNGKILFIPSSLCGENWTWTNLYTMGLVFGTDDFGAWRPEGTLPVNQLKIIEKGFNRFIVRLPTGADDRNNPTRFVADNTPVSIRRHSETADCHYPIQANFIPTTQRVPRIANAMTGQAGLNNGREILCQEKYKTGCLAGLPALANTSAEYEALAPYSLSVPRGWKPTLELVQSDFVIGEAVI